MKTSLDPRHIRRKKIVESLFSQSFLEQKSPASTSEAGRAKIKKVHEILANLSEIDKNIYEIAPEFPIDKINRIDLAILRLAVFELLIEKKEPPKVIVDEAVEIAKEFGGDSSPAFINGALGNLLKKG